MSFTVGSLVRMNTANVPFQEDLDGTIGIVYSVNDSYEECTIRIFDEFGRVDYRCVINPNLELVRGPIPELKNEVRIPKQQNGRIGFHGEARQAADIAKRCTGTPEGWKYLGSGAFRKAYLAPSGTVYKVQHSFWDEDNIREMENIERISGKPFPGWRVPKCTLYVVEDVPVIAMEYVKGSQTNKCQSLFRYAEESVCDCTPVNGKHEGHDWNTIRNLWNIQDVHGANVLRYKDEMVLIDVADAV